MTSVRVGRLIAAAGILSGMTLVAIPGPASAAPPRHLPSCAAARMLCAEITESEEAFGQYVGHDEPELNFYSAQPGSGNNMRYSFTLPKDPRPSADHRFSYSFQLRPAMWFGMDLCDTRSYPEQVSTCTPDSDSNIVDPRVSPRHPGTAFMELQFYPPGWVQQFDSQSCDATHWCAALTIDSLSRDPVAGKDLNDTCANQVLGGIEYVNFAYLTRNGKPQGPPDPLHFDPVASGKPDPNKVLMMGQGDEVTLTMHDTPHGVRAELRDETTHQSGSMTASAANGFGQIKYAPSATTCTLVKAPFHPMYATSSENTRVVWAAHSYNVAFSDEIGHFEYCNAATELGGNCTQDGVGDTDTTLSGAEDDTYCFVPPFGAPVQSTRIKVGGCFGTDTDFDGVAYQPVWPGSTTNSALETGFHPTSILFTSPTFNSGSTYGRLAFEADLPRIEFDTNPSCNRSTGANCVYPPVGANFYPIYTTGTLGSAEAWSLSVGSTDSSLPTATSE